MAHYYICSQNRTKGAFACHANGIRKEKAEKEVFKRRSDTLNDKKLIKDIVNRINKKRTNKTEPLEEELSQLENRIGKVAEKKDKYFNLFDENIINSNVLAEKLAEIESELSDSSTTPVTYNLVEQSLKSFNKLLKQASTEQQKSLLRLVVKEITMTMDKEIDTIKLGFDEEVRKHFLSEYTECDKEDFPSGKSSFRFTMVI